ncbi:hypothetical protein IV203_019432 [Nitzschia inconspicua]|uniref:Uncharacterized protein n=1 Tax=Nitzschia inconspicua TaxID=303405 RepID=A0A9K3LZ47_9STRA|nr:hypothetical protein IV203_019432 [Nitzschia inconspicua]
MVSHEEDAESPTTSWWDDGSEIDPFCTVCRNQIYWRLERHGSCDTCGKQNVCENCLHHAHCQMCYETLEEVPSPPCVIINECLECLETCNECNLIFHGGRCKWLHQAICNGMDRILWTHSKAKTVDNDKMADIKEAEKQMAKLCRDWQAARAAEAIAHDLLQQLGAMEITKPCSDDR